VGQRRSTVSTEADTTFAREGSRLPAKERLPDDLDAVDLKQRDCGVATDPKNPESAGAKRIDIGRFTLLVHSWSRAAS
jgi:hypothetical protein